MTELQHKTIKAAAVATDQGVFSAIAAAYSVDRVKDRIIPGAFAKTIEAWGASGKNVPLHWDHSGKAEDIIGFVSLMREQDDGLYVEGQLDVKASDTAREAWRSMKNNAVALSFGYLAKSRKGTDGVTELTEIDLFEVSIVAAPANADTRVLSTKALAAEAWKLVLRDELERVPKGKPTDEPKALARFPDVQTEDDFKALSFHDKLAVYYAGLDDGAMDAEADEQPAKAAWAKAYATELPDSSFLYCGRFTERDEKGNMATEDRRFFPVREPDGTLDVAHLRDALTRISLSSLPQKVKEKLTAETHQALKKISADTASAVEDGTNDEPEKAKSVPQDPLVREAWDLIVPRHTPGPQREPEPAPEPLDVAQVQREAWALALDTSGD